MVGLYGCAGLAVLCIFGGWLRRHGIDLAISRVTSYRRRHGRAMAKFLLPGI
ncbi:hypothetical protein ACNKHT_08360 [Shigella flexneri]